MSSLKYRKERVKKIIRYWNFRKCHDLMASFKPKKKEFDAFKNYIKIYISKSLDIDYFQDDTEFLKSLEKGRKNRTNVTPNGGIVPKREFHLEYNLVLREWANLVRNFTKNKEFAEGYYMTDSAHYDFVAFGTISKLTKYTFLKGTIDYKDSLQTNNYFNITALRNEIVVENDFLKLIEE